MLRKFTNWLRGIFNNDNNTVKICDCEKCDCNDKKAVVEDKEESKEVLTEIAEKLADIKKTSGTKKTATKKTHTKQTDNSSKIVKKKSSTAAEKKESDNEVVEKPKKRTTKAAKTKKAND